MLGIEWVLDWNRILNLLVVLLPFFAAVGGAFKYLLDRAERRENARAASETARRDAEEEAREEKRRREIDDMNIARQSFHADILKEAGRMRELYENELGRGLALRTALADAAQRETILQQTIFELTRKVENLQEEVKTLRAELAAK